MKNKSKLSKRRIFFIVVISAILFSVLLSFSASYFNLKNNTVAYSNFNDFDEFGCINSQGDMSDFKFGLSTLNSNGCGSIALFNVLTLANKNVFFPEVVKSMDMFGQNAFGFLGTNPASMLFYLRSQNLKASISFNSNKFNDLANTSNASIYGYLSFHGGHYVALHKISDGFFQIHNPKKVDTMQNLIDETKDYFIKFLIYTQF